MKHLLVILLFLPLLTFGQVSTDLVGNPSASAPYFSYHQTHNGGQEVYVGADPAQFAIDGESADVYITINKSADEWLSDPSLIDVRGSAQMVSFSGVDVSETAFLLSGTASIDNFTGARPGTGYDLVIDLNQDGQLSSNDLIDGIGDEAGFYLVGDMFEPGPFSVDTAFHSTSFWHTLRVYYPSNIQELDPQPLVVVSHGWTHEYWYYDYIGYHLASYGYVVMSHRNEVGNGGAMATETASSTALENIDEFLTHVDSIGGGILAGKVNKNLIVHTGHSTGGECVVRAYKRLFDGNYLSPHITHENIVCVSSLAPVAFLPGDATHPEGCNYHQFLAGADTDVSGAPYDGYVQAFSIYERGYGNKQVTYIHGAGHEDLHDEDGNPLAAGPDLIGKEATHTIVKPYFLALCELYTRNNLSVKEFFTRNRNVFRPANISPSLKISGEYRNAIGLDPVIEDFQTNSAEDLSSSGGAVSTDLVEYHEVLMQDIDESFSWTGDQWSNGMTRARYDDEPKCATLAWGDDADLSFDIVPDLADWTESDFLSFRACQMTRHPLNSDTTGLAFTVTVEDMGGNIAVLNTSAYGMLMPPYPRGGGGYLSECLEEGVYTVIVGGSQWESEMSFSIPGYIEDGTAGEYELIIGAGDPCTEIEVFMYDSWGDGWDDGNLQILNADDEVVAEGTLQDGSTPDAAVGWQNEFYTYQLPIADFKLGGNNVDFSNMAKITFGFGPSNGSATGAIGLDDIELSGSGLSYLASAPGFAESAQLMQVYPNPAHGFTQIRLANVSAPWSYNVYNSEGKLVTSSEKTTGSLKRIELQDVEPGIYMLTVVHDHNILTSRLVIQ